MEKRNKRKHVVEYHRSSNIPCNLTLEEQCDSLRKYLDDDKQKGNCEILCNDANESSPGSQKKKLEQYIEKMEKEACEVVEVNILGDGRTAGDSSIIVVSERVQ